MIYGGGNENNALGPWYGLVRDRQNAVDHMYDKLSFSNWRLITYHEMYSWVEKMGDGNLRTYLNNSGWVNPPLYPGMMFGSYENNGMWWEDEDVYYYHLDLNPGFGWIPDANEYQFGVRFFWIVCRDMETNEMKKYFW
jgi:hypothetical protein